MAKFNPEKHHRRSIRLKGYDYSREGFYFLTICCKNMAHLFGNIVREPILIPGTDEFKTIQKMELNDAGKIANECWLAIPEHHPYAILHNHVIMPNHVHGIIQITRNSTNGSHGFQSSEPVGANDYSPLHSPEHSPQHPSEPVGANDYSPLRSPQFKSPSKTVGSIVRGYKIGVTKWMRNNTEIYDVWQSNYYERIIKNDHAFVNVSNYINKNPEKWEMDEFNIK